MRFETEHSKFVGRVVSPADSHIKEKEQNSIKYPCFSLLERTSRGSNEVGRFCLCDCGRLVKVEPVRELPANAEFVYMPPS